MSRYLNRISISILTLSFVCLLWVSCKKDNGKDNDFTCPEIACVNGLVTQVGEQTCNCECEAGFEGDSCEVSKAWTTYKGFYRVIDSCLSHNRYSYSLTIEATPNKNEIYMPDFREIFVSNPEFNNFNDFQPKAIINGNKLNIPFQSFDEGNTTMQGEGTISGTTFTLTYTLLHRGVEETCTAYFTKQ